MSRITNAPASRKRRKRRLKLARGFSGGRHRLFRTATEAVDHAMSHAYESRKQKKRTYRAMWIVRISAACKERGLSYNRFIEAATKSGVVLNRKMLSEIAIHDPAGFDQIIQKVGLTVK